MDDEEIRRLTERIRGAGALAPDRTDDVIPMLTEVVVPSAPGPAGTTLPQDEAPPAAAEISDETFDEIADDTVGESIEPDEEAIEGEAFDAEARAAFEARVVESILERLRNALEPAVRDAVREAVDDALRDSTAEPPGPL